MNNQIRVAILGYGNLGRKIRGDTYQIVKFSSLFTEHIPISSIIRGAANGRELRTLIERISELFQKSEAPYKDSILRGYLLAFVGRLFTMTKFKKVDAEDIHALGSVMNYCIAHYRDNLSLDLLQKKLHISKYYISHIMNQKLGMGFNDYINALRVSEACRYLRRTNKSITEISTLVGFGTLRTFNRAFFKQVGMSPSDYRKTAPRAGEANRNGSEVANNA